MTSPTFILSSMFCSALSQLVALDRTDQSAVGLRGSVRSLGREPCERLAGKQALANVLGLRFRGVVLGDVDAPVAGWNLDENLAKRELRRAS